MKRVLYFFLVTATFYSCSIGILSKSTIIDLQSTESSTELINKIVDSIENPLGYIKKQVFECELFGDALLEKVIVFEKHNQETGLKERRLNIYTQEDQIWNLNSTCESCILNSDEGGVLGDPFVELDCVKGRICISHYGGSRNRWSVDHCYKYVLNNGLEDWFLVNTKVALFTFSEYEETFHYNLISGDAYHFRIEEIYDDNDEIIRSDTTAGTYNVKIEKLPKMTDFIPGNGEFVIPEGDKIIYY